MRCLSRAIFKPPVVPSSPLELLRRAIRPREPRPQVAWDIYAHMHASNQPIPAAIAFRLVSVLRRAFPRPQQLHYKLAHILKHAPVVSSDMYLEAMRAATDYRFALLLLNDMRSSGVSILPSHYETMFIKLVNQDNTEEASTWILLFQKQFRADATLEMYAALLNAHLRSKEMRQAKRLFTHIHQLVPSTPLVSIQQATRVHKALLRYAYTIANARLYLTLIKQMEQRLAALGDGRLPWSLWLRCFRLHVMHGRRSKAAEVWKMAMAKPALGKPRDAHKNATVIMQRQASGAAHHVSDIRHLEQILLDMETLQLPIPPRIVANAMHTYRSRGMFQQAVDLFQRHKDLLRTSEYAAEYVYLWTEAMAVYADLFDPKQVDRLFHEMQERGIHPSPVTWAARIHAWARCGEFDAVNRLLVQLHATTPAVRSVLLNAYIQFDRMEEAIVRWLPEFTLKERPRMHPILVNTLLAGWSRKGTIGRALQLWHSLASSEWDQITIRIMLNMCLWHRLEEGEAVWQRLVESGRDIWYSCWYTRAKYLGHAEQWEVLQRTLYTMPTKFVSKDLVAMCIALMRHAQQEHAASQVLAWARGRSIGVSERSIHDCQTALARHMTS